MWKEIKFFDGVLPASNPMPEIMGGGSAGAAAEFTGNVRAQEKDARIAALRYEIYRPMALKVLDGHIEEMGRKYGLLAVRFWHREGIVPVGDASVYVFVSAPHRKEAFAAIAELLDRLKTDVPIWKVEALSFSDFSNPEADSLKFALMLPQKKAPAPDSIDGVWKLLAERVAVLGDERVPLADALQRTLRADVKADADQPPFDRSAMDGYAILPGAFPAKYRVIGTVKAGEVAVRAPASGEALRIFTGAQVPAPGLAVVMQEYVRIEGEFIIVEREVKPGENVRHRGSDARAGDVILTAGTKLNAPELAILASVGATLPLVNALPRVAHATTGDEIVPPEAEPEPGQVRDSNQILISTLLQNSGVPAANIHQEHWGDDPARAAQRLAAEPFAKADIILISGGASVGAHDYTARLLEAAGFELAVRKVNLRPGRPLIVGFRGKQIAFGLPGNPVSHFTCYLLFVHLAIKLLLGRGVKRPMLHTRTLSETLTCAPSPRPTFWPARMTFGLRRPSLTPLAWNNSGHLAALAGANALIFVPSNTSALPAGTPVRFVLSSSKGRS